RPPDAAPPLRRPSGTRNPRGGGDARRRPARLGPHTNRGRDRRLPPPRGEPPELRMTEIGATLARELGPDRVAEDAATLAAHRTDYWILAHLRARQGRLAGGPACVVRPHGTAEVARTIRLAQRHGVPVVAYGAGSGVVGGATPPAGALVVDLRAMNALLELNETALYARVQAGMMGDVYEATVGARGYTTGHYPQSIALSTVGGWVATRAAGQFSTRYGNIEDLCLGLEAVLPSGEVVRLAPVPRSSVGPSLRELFLGS